jgi:hypothetical protein
MAKLSARAIRREKRTAQHIAIANHEKMLPSNLKGLRFHNNNEFLVHWGNITYLLGRCEGALGWRVEETFVS